MYQSAAKHCHPAATLLLLQGAGVEPKKEEKPDIKVEDEEREEEIPELLVEVPPRCKSLPRNGLRQAELESDVSWQRVFDPALLLCRKHCKDGQKVPEVLFPDAPGRCAP